MKGGRDFVVVSFVYYRLLYFVFIIISIIWLFDGEFDCKFFSLKVYTVDLFQHGNKKSQFYLKLFLLSLTN